MYNSPIRTTARFLPGSPLPTMAMDGDNSTVGEPEKHDEKDTEENVPEEEQDNKKRKLGKQPNDAKKAVPKTKPKAKAKPCTKAKAKASGKAKAQGTKSKGEPEDPMKAMKAKKPQMKKPAAAKPKPCTKAKASKSMLDTFASLQKGVAPPKGENECTEEGEEEEEKEVDEEVEPEGEKRLRGPAGKFARLQKAGKVPSQIQELWDNCNGRADQTALLNRLFVKNNKTGSWDLKAENPKFQAWLKTTDRHFGKESTKSFPRSIMLHHYFQGNEAAFQEALACGDIQEVVMGNKVMYNFESVEAGREKSKDHTMQLDRGASKLKKEEHATVSDVLSNFDWKKFGTSSPALENKKKHSTLAITNGPPMVPWSAVEPHVLEAKAAHERVLKDLNKCYKPVAASNDMTLVSNFKSTLTALQANQQELCNCLMFKDHTCVQLLVSITFFQGQQVFQLKLSFPPSRNFLEQPTCRKAMWTNGW